MRDEAGFDPATVDWARLAALRERFLAGGPGTSGWRDAAEVALYDATFGRRVAWKWRAVLDELGARGFVAPAGRWLDWGAGSAIATREVLERSRPGPAPRVTLVDRSAVAFGFARAAIGAERPDVEVELARAADPAPWDLVLVSHVMRELDARALGRLVAVLAGARCFVWVESAGRDESRALSAVRERLLDALDPVAPCAHREACGALAAGRERDWCHFFAVPPPESFTSSAWSAFGRRLGIDLRSLPYSFLAMAARGARAFDRRAARLVGRPRVERAALRQGSCEPDGLHERRLLRRRDRELFAELGDPRRSPRLVRWRIEDGEIAGLDARLG